MQGNARGTYGSGCYRTLLHAIVYHCIYYCTSLQILLTSLHILLHITAYTITHCCMLLHIEYTIAHHWMLKCITAYTIARAHKNGRLE